jgi:hypothetical protein
VKRGESAASARLSFGCLILAVAFAISVSPLFWIITQLCANFNLV